MSESVVAGPEANRATQAAPHRFAISALLIGLVANAIGHSFVLIVLPPLGRQMGFGDVQTGLLLSLSAVALTIAGLVWGNVSETWGRRRVLLVGLAAAATFPAALALIVEARLSSFLAATPAFMMLLGLRLTASAVVGGVMPAAQAYVADATTADRRAGGMGMMGAAFGVGTIIGGGLAFGLGGTHPATALWLLSALTFAGMLMAGRRLQDIQGARPARHGADARVPWRAITPYLLVTLCGLSVYSLLQQVTALRLQDAFGQSPADSIRTSGVAMMATMAAMIAVQGLVVRRLTWTPARLLRLGAVAAVVSLCAAALAPAVPVLILAMIATGAAYGLMLPGNLASLSLQTGSGAQGKVAGVNAVAKGIGMAVGPLAGAVLHQVSPAMPYWACAAALMVVSVLAFAASRNTFAE
jgi:MFS family permease